MNTESKIVLINAALQEFFKKNPGKGIQPAKDFMPLFIEKGIFTKDHRSGLPIRQVLRELDAENQLHRIPYVRAEHKQKNTFWYFAPLST